MKYQEILNKSLNEIYETLYNLKKELLTFRIQQSTGTTINTSNVRKNRRSIARIKTLLVHRANNK